MPVDPKPDFPSREKERLERWYAHGIVQAYLHKNDDASETFSFLDGPITANNPMGVHHAWGRSYKDLWQKYHNMRGRRQRFQNGFDCQGLWVEVEVEKELGLRSKKDIENLVEGDPVASIAKFVQMCKDRVLKFAGVQTEQSKRLGYFMDWENSYFTMSEENNYMIWHFLKTCHEHGWVYKGHDTVPWCPRCETAISQHEMLTEDYKEAVHESIFVKLPTLTPGWEHTHLLIWTTTPWTMPANVAVGVNTEYTYGVWKNAAGERLVFLHKDADDAIPNRQLKKRTLPINEYVFDGLEDGSYEWEKDIRGHELVGLVYEAPFDSLERVQSASKEAPELFHTVVDASELVNAEEGTGMLHVATGAGTEDFRLGQKLGLPVIEVIADDATYLDGLGELAGLNAKKHPEEIINRIRDRGMLHKSLQYAHRYPACWRCKAELVWKVADEWYISMDTPSASTGKTFRAMMIENVPKIHWMPGFGLERELDWLNHMSDWLISKKNRYWGLALPIYECESCQTFTVIGGRDELQEKAVEGWDAFEGHTPHKPYIDMVKVTCPSCGSALERIGDVGNPWLDAGIVPYSTISKNNDGAPLYSTQKDAWREWFPADFITESFPGQFKNWFYALIAMSTALENEIPFKNVLGFGTLLAEDGRAMHKSWGNSIEFNEGADEIGVDVMRWMYARTNPAENMLFGYKIGDEVRRSFLLMIWNIYRFFVDYATLDGYSDQSVPQRPKTTHSLDEWIIHRLHLTCAEAEKGYDSYDARLVTQSVEELIEDISTWYIRRSRERVWTGSKDKADSHSFYQTLHYVLVQLMIIISPIVPFVSDEMYCNLTGQKSVHLADWPTIQEPINEQLLQDMATIRKIAESANRARREAGLKVKQPLQSLTVTYSHESLVQDESLWKILVQEINVKNVNHTTGDVLEPNVELDTHISDELRAEGEAREIVRSIQQERQTQGLDPHDTIVVTIPSYPAAFEEYIRTKVGAQSLQKGDSLSIAKV